MSTFNLGFTPFAVPCEYWNGDKAITVVGFRLKSDNTLFWITASGQDVAGWQYQLHPLGSIVNGFGEDRRAADQARALNNIADKLIHLDEIGEVAKELRDIDKTLIGGL